jgi:hypothetical protein
MARALTDRVTVVTHIRKRFMDPTLLERPGCSAPPRLYNEIKYEGLRRFAQPLRKFLLHTRVDEYGLEGPRMSRLLYETGS